MQALKVIGQEKVGQYEFTGIEGGFGENKKAMLVKDIAVIHGKPIKQINRRITENRKRFKDGIDIIDFLSASEALRKFAEQNGFIGSNRTQHVYLLSERGYSKLLKILEDDKAWEIYDELVDNYFNMRQSLKTDNKALMAEKRLAIMEDNSRTRRANLMFKIAMEMAGDEKTLLLEKAAETLTGKTKTNSGEYTASDIGKLLGVTAMKVGKTANALGLKAEPKSSNEYGRWGTTRASNGKIVDQFIYNKTGKKAIEDALKGDE